LGAAVGAHVGPGAVGVVIDPTPRDGEGTADAYRPGRGVA
jgi:hypothetical protein